MANLFRLNFTAEIKNYDALNFPENEKFDIVLLDAPCSAIGTIRKNPDIIFRKKAPNLNSLYNLQERLLKKAALLLNSNGVIVYMVCSFFFNETLLPIKKFLKKNKEFSILKYNNIKNQKDINSLITKEGYFLTAPGMYKNFNIDGFFSIQLIKND